MAADPNKTVTVTADANNDIVVTINGALQDYPEPTIIVQSAANGALLIHHSPNNLSFQKQATQNSIAGTRQARTVTLKPAGTGPFVVTVDCSGTTFGDTVTIPSGPTRLKLLSVHPHVASSAPS